MAVNVKQQQTEKQEEEEDHESTEYNLSQQIIKQFDEQQKIVNLLFSFLQMTIFQHDRNASVRVALYENLSKMLLKTTLQVENFHIRLEVLNKIKDIISNRSGTPEITPMLRIVKILTLEIQPSASQFESRCF
jgi:Cdc6-like AAA superfamily ATPase